MEEAHSPIFRPPTPGANPVRSGPEPGLLFCHTRDAEEQGAAESALRFPSPRVSGKQKKKKSKSKHSLMPRLSPEEGGSLVKLADQPSYTTTGPERPWEKCPECPGITTAPSSVYTQASV